MTNPTPRYTPERNEDRCSKKTCTQIFIQYYSEGPTEEWLNKMWSVHTQEHYSAIKINEVLIQATTWMDLRSTLSERIQTQKSHIIVRLLLCEISRDIERRLVTTRA